MFALKGFSAVAILFMVIYAVYLLLFAVKDDENIEPLNEIKSKKENLQRLFKSIENDKKIIQVIDTIEDKIKSKEYKKEFDKVRTIGNGTFHAADTPENRVKSRYAHLLSYDHKRVILATDDNSSDFINANYIDGYKQKDKFISTQGPIPNTIEDFWRMIWGERTQVISMNTNATELITEGNKTFWRQQSEQYWPQNLGEVMELKRFRLKTVEVQTNVGFVVSEIEVTKLKTNETRTVSHFWCTMWPDLGVPATTSLMLKFIEAIEKKQKEKVEKLGDSWTGNVWGPPIVSHCSAGLGRTGLFIAVYNAVNRFADTKTVDLVETSSKIRAQRNHAFEKSKQFRFFYESIIEYARNFLKVSNVSSWSDLIG